MPRHGRIGFLLILGLTLGASCAPLAAFMPPLRADWRTFQTEHFQFYFHGSTETLARSLAPLAEQIHDRLSKELSMPPAGRTHVLIYDDTDEFNGSAQVFPRNTIMLFATTGEAGGDGPIGGGLLETFVHEYTHILQIGYVSDLPQAVNSLVGKVLSPNMYLPYWCAEGLAVAMESEFFPSGRLHSSTWRMYLRADFLAGRTLSWPQVTNGIYTWPYENAWYLYGSFFTQYLIDRYGLDAVTAFYRATGGDLPYLSFAECFKAAFGRTIREAVADWHAAAAAGFSAEADRVRAVGLREGIPIAPGGGRSGWGTFGPDGRLYFIKRTYQEPAALMAADPPYAKADRLAGFAAGRPSVAPDGSSLVYGLLSPHGGDLYSDLYMFRWRDRKTIRLSRGLRADEPAWSPDGRTIAFIRNAPPNHCLYRMDASGGGIRAIWEAVGQEQAFDPAWSPDGRRLAFARYRASDGLRIWIIEPDGAELRVLHGGPALGQEMQPAWSPDGRYVFFAADPDGIYNIYACEPETGRLWQVTNVLTGAYAPAVSPDGRILAYTGYTAAGYGQYVMAIQPSLWQPAQAMSQPAPPAAETSSPGYFSGYARPDDSPAVRYRPAETLAPALGFLSFSGTTTGDYDIQIYLAGMDVLQTVAYTVNLESTNYGPSFEAELDLRLRPGVLKIGGSMSYDDLSFPGLVQRDWLASIQLAGETRGIRTPDDSLGWRLTGYFEQTGPWDGAAPPYTCLGGELSLSYGSYTLCRGPVDLAAGYVLSGSAGLELERRTGATVDWQNAEAQVFLPLGRSRLELAAGLDANSAGAAAARLGAWSPGPEGYLVWDSQAKLEFPFLHPESGGVAAPGYLHAVNGLAGVWAGQALEPGGPLAWSYGLGLNFRLQAGFQVPVDLSLLAVQRAGGSGVEWVLGYEAPY